MKRIRMDKVETPDKPINFHFNPEFGELYCVHYNLNGINGDTTYTKDQEDFFIKWIKRKHKQRQIKSLDVYLISTQGGVNR